jgi:uncharacterized protein (TIGR00730 family)
MSKRICVYSSSSNLIPEIYINEARELGRCIVEYDYDLIYGGGNVGLMAALAGAVHENAGRVIGVIPESLKEKELAYEEADELIVTKTMRERKEIMEASADAFIALPGGFGTLEEILEIITLKQLKYHNKPVVFINTNDFYWKLFELFNIFYAENFVQGECEQLYYIALDAEEALSYIDLYDGAST